MKEELSKLEIEYWSSLAAGERIEAYNQNGCLYLSGCVETTAPDLVIIWIRTDLGERKLLNVQDDTIRPPLSSS